MCERICLPAEARLELTLSGAASPYAGLVAAALSASPSPVPPKKFGDLSPDGVDGWRLCATHVAGKPRDLFVEPPDGWQITAAPELYDLSRDCFKLTLREMPKGADMPVALRLTMTGGQGPVETVVEAARLR